MIKNTLAVVTCFAAISGVAHAATPSVMDKEFSYLQGNLEAVLSTSQSGPMIDLGAGIRVDGETKFKTGYGATFVLGKQWRRDRKDEEPRYHRGELELMSLKLPRKSVTLLETVSAGGSVRADALFANYLYRVSASRDYRFLLGAGIGLARMDIPDGPAISPDCNCPQGGSETGLAYQLKAAAQREYRPNLLLQGYVAYRSFPGMKQGALPSTEYKRLNQGSIGVGFQYLFN